MSDRTQRLGPPTPPRQPVRPPAVPKPPSRSLWARRFSRRPVATAYHRCLAVHIHYASARSALT